MIEFERTKENISKAKKLYIHEPSKPRRKRLYSYLILIVLLFFCSKLYIPAQITAENEVTKIGDEIEYSDSRSVTVLSSEYSKEQGVMELLLEYNNDSYDGIDEYFYAATLEGGSEKELDVKEVMNKQMLTVVQIKGIYKFDELTFMLAPKTVSDISQVSDDDTATLIFNKYNLNYVSKIDLDKNANDYLSLRCDMLIEKYQKKVEKSEKKEKNIKESIEGLKEENKELTESEKIMTENEKVKAEARKTANNESISSYQTEFSEQKSKTQEYQNELEALKKQKDLLQKNSKNSK